MKILLYNELNIARVKKQFDKTIELIKQGNFVQADIKKMAGTGFYRAKLDYENRLLFKFARYNNETYALILEVILNHEYEKSRFLKGAKIDENKLIPLKNEAHIPEEAAEQMRYINPNSSRFHLLDKIISFDNMQEELFRHTPPIVIVGSAGSGKTVLTLEKIKNLRGNILYVTLSPFLVENSSKLYFSNNYENEKQEIDFLSFREFLETIRILPGIEFDQRIFNQWIQTRKQVFKIKDTYKLFEEFKGVITGMDISRAYLCKEEYLKLGVKQSVFLETDRPNVYEAFLKYLNYMRDNHLVDMNILSFQWLGLCKPKYDFIVIDEVQDFTNIQLYLILKSLKTPGNFMLCGDSNQVVHPNFFSWANVKTMFYKHDITPSEIEILRTNYRNSKGVTSIANRILMIKNARFGSLDKESTYLINTISEHKGEVEFLSDKVDIKKQLNDRTGRSTNYAVLVLKPEQKNEAKKYFTTPLLFSIHEAKGLEYENIILFNFVSANNREFSGITRGVSGKNLDEESFSYTRARNKTDKDLDAYKFFINSLYVGITRAVKNLYILESSDKHEIFPLLGLTSREKQHLTLKTEISSDEEWRTEARRLEMQGKNEQADDIRKNILSFHTPDWIPVTPQNLPELKKQALDPQQYNKKAKDKLFAYALIYEDMECINKLSELKYRKADNYKSEYITVYSRYYQAYISDNVNAVNENIKKYGPDYRDPFNLTPVMAALNAGSLKILDFLSGLDIKMNITDHLGRTPVQLLVAKAYTESKYHEKLEKLYPVFITDSIKIKINEQLIKIDNRKMEFFLINLFISLQKRITEEYRKKWEFEGVTAMDLEKIVENYPENVLPEYRKRRTYISSVLAKNEVDSDNPYNRMILIRIDKGLYLLNPELEIMSENVWENVYEIIRMPAPRKLTFYEKEVIKCDKFIADLERDIKFHQEKGYKWDIGYMTELIQHHKTRKKDYLHIIETQKKNFGKIIDPYMKKPKKCSGPVPGENKNESPAVIKEKEKPEKQQEDTGHTQLKLF